MENGTKDERTEFAKMLIKGIKVYPEDRRALIALRPLTEEACLVVGEPLTKKHTKKVSDECLFDGDPRIAINQTNNPIEWVLFTWNTERRQRVG